MPSIFQRAFRFLLHLLLLTCTFLPLFLPLYFMPQSLYNMRSSFLSFIALITITIAIVLFPFISIQSLASLIFYLLCGSGSTFSSNSSSGKHQQRHVQLLSDAHIKSVYRAFSLTCILLSLALYCAFAIVVHSGLTLLHVEIYFDGNSSDISGGRSVCFVILYWLSCASLCNVFASHVCKFTWPFSTAIYDDAHPNQQSNSTSSSQQAQNLINQATKKKRSSPCETILKSNRKGCQFSATSTYSIYCWYC